MSKYLGAGVIIGISMITTSVEATVIFSDGDFDNWISVPITPGQIGEREINGGNPGAFWEVTTITNNRTNIFHTNPLFVYDPSLRPLESVVFSIEFNNLATFGAGQSVYFFAEQNESYFFIGTQSTGTVSGWNPLLRSGQVFFENDFLPFPGSSGSLDFSGEPITFGFGTGNEGGNTIRVGYDNYEAILTITENTAIPEPSTIIGLGVLATLGIGTSFKCKLNQNKKK